jgi:hypothetical protein
MSQSSRVPGDDLADIIGGCPSRPTRDDGLLLKEAT